MSVVTFESNKKIITLNNTCYWSEVNNSSDISVDCVRYDNHSLCFNLKECISDCSQRCTKNLCLINRCNGMKNGLMVMFVNSLKYDNFL